MAALTPYVAAEAGVAMTYASAGADGDTFKNDGNTILLVKNGSGSPVTVTVTAQKTSAVISGLGPVTKADGGGSVAAGGESAFGPFPISAFNNEDGEVEVTYSSETSVTVAAVKVVR